MTRREAADEMQVHEQSDGTLVLTYDSTRLSALMVALAAVVVAVLGYDTVQGSPAGGRMPGLLLGLAMCLVMALVAFERVRVVLNPLTRSIEWTATWAFRHRNGTLSFDDVDAVLAERPIGDDGLPSRRLVLRTKDGRSIPLMVAYRPDGKGAILHASERIRGMLGKAADTAATARALVDAGRAIDAVRLVRETEEVSLTDAKRRVDALRSREPSS